MPSIVELLMRQGAQQAAIQERYGQIVGNMAQQFGQIPGQILQAKQADQQQQLTGLQLQNAQRDAKSVQAFQSAMTDPANWQPDGTVDENKVAATLRSSDIGAYEHYVT